MGVSELGGEEVRKKKQAEKRCENKQEKREQTLLLLGTTELPKCLADDGVAVNLFGVCPGNFLDAEMLARGFREGVEVRGSELLSTIETELEPTGSTE